MNRSNYALSSALIFISSASGAQVTSSPVQATISVTPATLGAPAATVLRSGTPVALRMSEGLTTEGKKLRVGQRFQLEVAEPIMLNGQIVVPAGSPATGEVTEVRTKGMWGKSGGINARVLYVRANGQQIRLTGQLNDKGVTGTAGVVGALVLVPVAGFFMTGTSARIPLGAPVNAFIDEDVAIAFVQGIVPAPMVVVAPPVGSPPLAVSE